MKHLKTYKKLFEGSELNPDQWEDVKDIIQSEILDKHHISFDDTEEKFGVNNKYIVRDPIFSIKFENLELSPYIIDDIYKLNRRVKELTGNFIIAKNNVNIPSKRNIEIMLSKTPDQRIVGEHFNLEECDTDNIINSKKSGFLCGDYNTGYETAVKILEWLNTFYRFCYPTEFEAFKLAYDTLNELYDVLIVFSMPKFEDDRFKQVVCFQFILSSKRSGESVIGNKYPIFIINTNHTESPQIRKRIDNYNWVDISFDKKERYIDFLKTEQF